jgi:hypothetical protein
MRKRQNHIDYLVLIDLHCVNVLRLQTILFIRHYIPFAAA